MAARLVVGAMVVRAAVGAPEAPRVNVSVAWHAPFYSGGGYCSEATTFVVALAQMGVPISIEPHGDGFNGNYYEQMDPGTAQALRALGSRPPSPARVTICHSEPGAWHVLDGPAWPSSACPRRDGGRPYVVGRTMFETDRLPKGWSKRLNAVDEVWVPTDFHRDIFEREGVRNVRVVGEPVDTEAFSPEGPTFAVPGAEPAGAFVVLSVFKWEKRKGWDVLLRAWRDAFAPTDAAVLVLLTNAYHSGSNFEESLDRFVVETLGEAEGLLALAKIVVLSEVSQRDLASLYRAADLAALPTRGEGWGRPHVEAMASGTPVAATNWSGPTAYLDASNGYPVDVAGLVDVGDGPFADHKWAEPDADHLARILRRARDDPAERAALGAKARADMVARFAPDKMASDVAAHLARIERALPRDARRSPRRSEF